MDDPATPAAPPSDDDLQVQVPSEPEKPISILAVASLLLAFAAGFVALGGLWQATAVPIGLAALTLFLISRSGRRGRLLAIFAIIVATLFGSCSFLVHYIGASHSEKLPQAMLTELSRERASSESAAEALGPWVAKRDDLLPDEIAGVARDWQAKYQSIVAEFGAWSGELERGDEYPGFYALVMPPTHGEELHAREGAKAPADGGAIWVKAVFAEGAVWVCVVLGTGEEDARKAISEWQEGTPSPIVGDIRYFRVR